MSRWIDLTGPLFNGMWSYNTLRGLSGSITHYASAWECQLAEAGFESFRYELSSLSGTYLENAGHLMEGVAPLLELPVSALVREAIICHLPRKGPGEIIRRAELVEYCPAVPPGAALLIECGWGAQWREPHFVRDTPAYHPDCAEWLYEQPCGLLGVDVPCIQAPYPLPDGAQYDGNILLPIFQKGVLLLAPLVQLDQVREQRGELIALPLAVEGTSGAPCRAVLRVDA